MNPCERIAVPILVICMGCGLVSHADDKTPTAPFGTIPTIDGTFANGEWDDAAVVQVKGGWCFRLKHDGTNLYLGLDGAGGNIWLDEGDSLRVLHASFALNEVRYARTDDGEWTRLEPSENALFGLQKETTAVVAKRMAEHLASEGWTASLIPMGNTPQKEFAVSLDALGIPAEERLMQNVETLPMYIFACPNLPEEELQGRAVWWHWPGPPETADEELLRGHRVETIGSTALAWWRVQIGRQQ